MRIIFAHIFPVSHLVGDVHVEAQASQCKEKIEYKDGTRVLKNLASPTFGKGACSIEEEFTIGIADGLEEYMFSSVMDMTCPSHIVCSMSNQF